MTERMVEDLHSDVWAGGASKSDFTKYTPEEELKEWREAVKVLDGFCQVADGLNHSPLILALVDAKVRAEEELERAQDRVERPEGVQLPRARMRGSWPSCAVLMPSLTPAPRWRTGAAARRSIWRATSGSSPRCAPRFTKPSCATAGSWACPKVRDHRSEAGPGNP
jgi:hypothetical protein